MARKIYMQKAEILIEQLVYAYYCEHGKLPDSMSTLKSALTRGYNNVTNNLHQKIYARLPLQQSKSGYPLQMREYPEYPQVLSDVMAEIAESID
ncbi:hypothetical protein MYO4S_00011 [Serratia phage 4S]|nr:hypothetical protein MYO4S_00011 [Serratia phage 4S]